LTGYVNWDTNFPDNNTQTGCTIYNTVNNSEKWEEVNCNMVVNNWDTASFKVSCQLSACDTYNVACCRYCADVVE
uniref:Uncharacterized protein n=1 Tax=Acrobeloides nanus TaxID=290746 RepID=A0A914DBP3_9BILA